MSSRSRTARTAGTGECQLPAEHRHLSAPARGLSGGGPAGEELKVKLHRRRVRPDRADGQASRAARSSASRSSPSRAEPTPQPNYLRVSQLPERPREPSRTTTSPSRRQTNREHCRSPLNGIIEKKGDVDCFKFTAKKGADYDVSVFARRLRSPLDSVLDIYDLKGNRLGGNDDSRQPRQLPALEGAGRRRIHPRGSRSALPRRPDLHLSRRDHAVEPKSPPGCRRWCINQNQERRAIAVPKGNRYATLVRIKRQDIGGEVQARSRRPARRASPPAAGHGQGRGHHPDGLRGRGRCRARGQSLRHQRATRRAAART